MPESVKISELPALSSVQPTDIVPVVDSTLTQTSKATAAQIAAIGGGPPGVNTVQTVHIQDGAVTAGKVGFTGPDKLVSRIASGAGGGVEIDCTPYARGLLQASDGTSARLYLNALQSTNNPTFTGQVRFDGGSAGTPSLIRSGVGYERTGIFFPDADAVAIGTNGIERFRVQGDGLIYTRFTDYNVNPATNYLAPTFPCRAFVTFNATALGGVSTTIYANQAALASRYGLVGTIGDNLDTRTKLGAIEAANNITLTLASSPTFNDAYGKGTFPLRNLGTETRANYTTPGDNKHWVWSTTSNSWVQIAASGTPWIGTATFTTVATGNPILSSGNVVSVARVPGYATGVFRITFATPMPQTNITVGQTPLELWGPLTHSTSAGAIVNVLNVASTYCDVRCQNTAGALIDAGYVTVAVMR